MDRFRELEAFVAVAETGAFNTAARRLGASPPAVTRLVGGLEARLGIRLLTRSTRRVALTEAGQRLFADGARLLADLAAAEASATGAHDVPRGVLRVTAPVQFGQRYIAPILRDYLDANAAMHAEALYLDRVVNLIDEGQDVAVRIGELPDSTLTAVRVGAVRRVVVAAPTYLARAGTPTTVPDLSAHRIVQASPLTGGSSWEFARADGRRTVTVTPTLAVNTVAAALDAAEAGFGLTRALSYQVADALAAGRLVEVLADAEDRALPIHLVHAEGRRAAAKVRAFVDLAADRLRRQGRRLSAAPGAPG